MTASNQRDPDHFRPGTEADAAARRRAPWRLLFALTAFGVALRAALLLLALPADIQSDEANYLYSALVLKRFGLYADQHRYLWPPGYPWLMWQAIEARGIAGVDLLRWIQVGASSIVGFTSMLLAWRLFSKRAAVACGMLWALHLPLAAYTHLLWNETLFLALFLPAIWHALVGLDRAGAESSRTATWRFLLSGLLFGASLYVKEMPLLLLPLVALVVLWCSLGSGPVEALRRASLVPLAALVVLLPWTLRNAEVYRRPVFSGATLGENVYHGLNARYANFDFFALRKQRATDGLPPMEELARRFFTDPPAPTADVDGNGILDARDVGWERAEEIVHPLDRQTEHLERGAGFALAHPDWLLRTRIKKWSDLVTPLSFFTRHQALGHYPGDGALAGALRVPLVWLSLVTSVLVVLLGALGFFLTLPGGSGRLLLGAVLGYVLAASSLVAMSRFRIPIEPILIVLAAGFLTHGPATRSILRIGGAAAAVAALAGLWWVAWPETVAAASMALGGPR